MIITRQIYRPCKPVAYELVFAFPRGPLSFYLDLSGNKRVPIPKLLQGHNAFEGYGPPTAASTGSWGDYYYDATSKVLYGPKVGFSWFADTLSRTPLFGYGPPTAVSAGNVGDYYFVPNVPQLVQGPNGIQTNLIPQLYGPKLGNTWAGITIGNWGFPAAIVPLVGSGSPVDTGAAGSTGAFYVDTMNTLYYGPKTGPDWTNIVGIPFLLSTYGTVSPISPTRDAGGSPGDYYIDLVDYLAYGPRGSDWSGLSGLHFYTESTYEAYGVRGDYYKDIQKNLWYGPKVLSTTWAGLLPWPEIEYLLVQGVDPMSEVVLAAEQQFQGGYRCFPKVVTPPSCGTVTMDSGEMGFVYTPSSRYWLGKDSFSYSLVNIFGSESDAKCIYVTIGL